MNNNTNHYENSSWYFTEAKTSASNALNNLWSVVPKSIDLEAVSAGAICVQQAYKEFDKDFNQVGASQLQKVSCFAAMFAATMLVSYPDETLSVIKETASISWEVATAAVYTVAAGAELAAALAFDANDYISFELGFVEGSLDIDALGDCTTDSLIMEF